MKDDSPLVLIALSTWEMDAFFTRDDAERLRTLFPDSKTTDPVAAGGDGVLSLFKSYRPEVVVTGWKTPLLPVDLDSLRYVCHLTGSVRWLIPRELIARGVKVTNWGPSAATSVAEHALMLILNCLRSLQRWGPLMNARYLPEATAVIRTRSLQGRRVGIHGFGLIARKLVSLLKPFNAVIAAYSEGVPERVMQDCGVRQSRSLQALASESDVLVSCEALTPKTYHSIDRSVLINLAIGSVFVNVGRGAVVDEKALVEIAKERQLRVGSDVFEQEPLAKDSPLYEIPYAIFSPHIAGPTPDQLPLCGALAIDNLERFCQGKPLQHEVTLEMFDRAT